MQNSYLKKILLENFRNFTSKSFEFEGNKILITGPNGSGKTSILEAISLLSAGRGLRSEKPTNLIHHKANYLKVSYDLESFIGNIIVSIILNEHKTKKNILLNDKSIFSNELARLTNIFWLTPQQNNLFCESSSERRKFFDRIVFSFEENHAVLILKYEHYQKERIKLLQELRPDEHWLDILEDKLAKTALEISKIRHQILGLLNNIFDKMNIGLPRIVARLCSKMDEIYELSKESSDNFIELFKKSIRSSRAIDSSQHKTNFGALKTDFMVKNEEKKLDANFCSTGEQQSCMILILIAHTELFVQVKQKQPILLLDELFVHLDDHNKSILSGFLNARTMQTFVSTTEPELCSDFYSHSSVIKL
ncbi:MAG: DNA replication and repair protein RecF [Rickettsiaceae bacterium]|nr:DNA replication and repair protein RecF [Rickettsiaceae bacterium]